MLVLKNGVFLGNVTHIKHQNGFTVSITSYDPADIEASQKHFHEHPNLYFVLKGGSLEKKGIVEAEQISGNLRFYFAGEEHQNVRKLFPMTSINMELELDWLKNLNINEDQVKFAINSRPDIKFLFLKIYKEIHLDDMCSAMSLQTLVCDLVSQLNGAQFKNVKPKWAETVYDLLNDNWNENLTLIELSKVVNVNPITISKFFPRYFGCTIGEFRRKIKVEKAISLIKSSSRSLSEIAYECGFSDQSHFIRVFKDFTDHNPKQFQRI